MPQHDLPEDQKAEFHSTLDVLHRSAMDLDNKLPMYSILTKEDDQIKRVIAVVRTPLIIPIV
jgi:hypothetical protein